jgi:hypothetical protein
MHWRVFLSLREVFVSIEMAKIVNLVEVVVFAFL